MWRERAPAPPSPPYQNFCHAVPSRDLAASAACERASDSSAATSRSFCLSSSICLLLGGAGADGDCCIAKYEGLRSQHCRVGGLVVQQPQGFIQALLSVPIQFLRARFAFFRLSGLDCACELGLDDRFQFVRRDEHRFWLVTRARSIRQLRNVANDVPGDLLHPGGYGTRGCHEVSL